MFSGSIKGNIDLKWVKQLQYQREPNNLILLAWNASTSIVKQNDCKNKTIWLTQTVLSKSFSLFHTTYIEDIKGILKDFFLFKIYIKRFSNKIIFKFSKNVELKTADDPKKDNMWNEKFEIKNLRAQFRLYRKRAGVWTPKIPHARLCVCVSKQTKVIFTSLYTS